MEDEELMLERPTNSEVKDCSFTNFSHTLLLNHRDISLENFLDQQNRGSSASSHTSGGNISTVPHENISYYLCSESKGSSEDRRDSKDGFINNRPPSTGDPNEIAAFWSARLDRLILDPQEPRSNINQHVTIPLPSHRNNDFVNFEDDDADTDCAHNFNEMTTSAYRPICETTYESYSLDDDNFYTKKIDTEEDFVEESVFPTPSVPDLWPSEHLFSDEILKKQPSNFRDAENYQGTFEDVANANNIDGRAHLNHGHRSYKVAQNSRGLGSCKSGSQCSDSNSGNDSEEDSNTSKENIHLTNENPIFDQENKYSIGNSFESQSTSAAEIKHFNSMKKNCDGFITDKSSKIVYNPSLTAIQKHSTCEVEHEFSNSESRSFNEFVAKIYQDVDNIETQKVTDISENKPSSPESNEIDFYKGIVCTEASSAQDILTTRYRLGNIAARRARSVITWSRWNISQVIRSPDDSSPLWNPSVTQPSNETENDINYINEGIERREAAIKRLINRRTERPPLVDARRLKPTLRGQPETIPETDELRFEETFVPTSHVAAVSRLHNMQPSVTRDETPSTAPCASNQQDRHNILQRVARAFRKFW